MSRSIAAIILGFLCINICRGNLVLEPDVIDCNCVYDEAESIEVAYFFEDFNEAFDLNWHCDDFDFTHMSFTKVPGALTLTTQTGTYERGDNNCKNVFYLNFPISQALDFQVTTCISNFEPNDIWNQAGLLLYLDEDNFLKYVYEYGEGPPPNNANKLLFTAEVETDGYPVFGWFETEQYSQKMWLRLIKRGNSCELYNSTDGETFNPLKVLLPVRITEDNTIPCPDFPFTKIGIFANNGGATGASEVDASFEFIEFKVLPVEPNIPDAPDANDVAGDVNVPPALDDGIFQVNLSDCNCVYNPDSNSCDCNCVGPEPEPLPIAYLFDDFNEALDLSWTILNEDESHWSLTKQPGALTITTQNGSFEFSNTDYANVFLIDFPVSQLMDFQITTCISNFQLREIWNQAGLLLWNDEDNYLKFVYEYGEEALQGNGILFTVGRQFDGLSTFDWFVAEQTPQTMWLRIIKRGEYYEMYTSTDGENFEPLKARYGDDIGYNIFPCLPFPIGHIGIFTSNYYNNSAPEVDASFDFFEFTTDIED